MDFLQIIKDAGIPVTADDLKNVFRGFLADSGSRINNDDKMSPFWRFVSVAITEPVLWFINLIALTIMPNAYVKYATGEFLDLLADAVNVERKPATKLTGFITFTRADTNLDIIISVGTMIQTASIFGVIYRLIVTQQTVFSGVELTVLAPVEAYIEGAGFNLSDNYYSVLTNAIPGITAVTNAAGYITTPGTDIESDDELRARVRNQFNTASDYHTDAVYKSMISAFPGVDIDLIWFVHDAPRGPGTANAYILFDFAAAISEYLAAINTYITDDGNHGHGDDLIVYQLPETSVTLAATIYILSFLTGPETDALQADIETFINAAFRENQAFTPTLTLPFSRFSLSKLGKELHEQFPDIQSIDFVQDDIVTELWIPRLTSLTITMEVI